MSDATQDELNGDDTKQNVRMRVDQIKREFVQRIEQAERAGEAVLMMMALLEIGIEGVLAMTGSQSSTLNLVAKAFQRVVNKPAGRI